MNIYLAGPISGLTKEEAFGWRDRVEEHLRWYIPSVRVYIPERVDFINGTGDGGAGYLQEIDKERGETAARLDFAAIADSQIVVFNLLQARKVSIGTMIELGWAYTLGKYIIVVMQSGAIHDHSFVRWCANRIVETVDGVIEEILTLSGVGIA